MQETLLLNLVLVIAIAETLYALLVLYISDIPIPLNRASKVWNI